MLLFDLRIPRDDAPSVVIGALADLVDYVSLLSLCNQSVEVSKLLESRIISQLRRRLKAIFLCDDSTWLGAPGLRDGYAAIPGCS